MKKLILPLAIAALFTNFSASAKTLTLGHAMSLDNAAHKGMVIFADKVKEKSNGDLTVKIFPNAQLGSERDQAEQVVTGAIDMAKINGSLAESFEPTFKVISIPFLFNSPEHMRSFMRSDSAEELLQSSKGKGFIGLTFYDSGSRSFYAKKPIKTPEDLAGLKIRVPESPTMMKMISLLGAKATPLPFTEVYTGLQQGVIDAAENNVSSLVEMRHSEVAKFYSMDQHTMSPDLIIISENTWANLSEEERKIMKEAAAESLEEEIKIWDQTENANVEKAKKMGVTFVEVDKAKFQEKVKPMLDDAKKDPKLSYFIDKIQAIK
ncbi:TRAP transporter substrate-binding protein [Vibrio algivorus]|uniref:C4-dicarboxylate ABC transporter substrate-binding protein n=1 Tax=Vibrio algivorus TaxID=1667024 RepID=A0A557NZV8_9VIBR|nr:TRAP transporter substrate-binding protein [Vibrio algivorus]TVO33956.1 TRAP transporter substrate-binding protein [Vibrio algivorus]GLT15290.1 C4-dicarboxylate ABC transporter substrate-binding protein [Vibrio algivorus]